MATTRAGAAAESAGRLAFPRLLRGHGFPPRPVPSWVADHMPPVKYVLQRNQALWRRVTRTPVAQRFYPQCSACSLVQSAAVRSRRAAVSVVSHHAGGPCNVRGPGGTWRLYHATGGALALTAVVADRAAAPLAEVLAVL